jgi:hypothetical protein
VIKKWQWKETIFLKASSRHEKFFLKLFILLFSVQYPWSFLIEKQQNGEKIFTDENWR